MNPFDSTPHLKIGGNGLEVNYSKLKQIIRILTFNLAS
jgi:hypothetical protein